jgi:hypothetical protein
MILISVKPLRPTTGIEVDFLLKIEVPAFDPFEDNLQNFLIHQHLNSFSRFF